jgi:hypothetical protein
MGAEGVHDGANRTDVRLWHLADIDLDAVHVCFRSRADIPDSRLTVR